MLSAPADLDESALADALERGWGIGVAAMAYRPVGWGSHHWEVADGAGARWFVTVDELDLKRLTEAEWRGSANAYAAATGVTPVPGLLDLYRLGWDVKDMAYDTAWLLRPHTGTVNDAKTWTGLSELIRRAG